MQRFTRITLDSSLLLNQEIVFTRLFTDNLPHLLLIVLLCELYPNYLVFEIILLTIVFCNYVAESGSWIAEETAHTETVTSIDKTELGNRICEVTVISK